MKTTTLAKVLAGAGPHRRSQLSFFALLNLGIVELLDAGALSASEAIRVFFNAENCAYVRKRIGSQVADKIMSHGVQLQDLFDVLPAREAQKEFQRELDSMRRLSLKLLERHKLVA